MKTKRISILMLITMLMMLMVPFVTTVKSHAVWDDNNFNVDWDNSSDGNLTVKGSTNGTGESFGKIVNKYKTVITFISAIGAVTMVAVFIINFMKLGTTSGNPQERQKTIMALVISGIAAAGLGSVALVVGIFYGMLKDNGQ